MSTEIERRTGEPLAVMSDDEIRRMYRIADSLARSGMFKDIRQAEQAFAKLIIGRDLGLTPAQSMQGLYLVEGNVQVAYPMLGAFVRSHEGHDYRVVEHDETKCSIEFLRDGESVGISTFTMEDAKAAGLADKKGSWQTARRNMLFARAMSNGCKWFVPEVLGGLPVYVEGEIVPQADLTAGEGDGQAQGIDLGPKVEAVLERAARLGHEGLADRATAEMALGGRSPEIAREWVERAHDELDRMEPPDAEVVPEASHGASTDEPPPEQPSDADPQARAEAMRDDARILLDHATAAADEGEDERADDFYARAEALMGEADALAPLAADDDAPSSL